MLSHAQNAKRPISHKRKVTFSAIATRRGDGACGMCMSGIDVPFHARISGPYRPVFVTAGWMEVVFSCLVD